jgi:hypothetical protein
MVFFYLQFRRVFNMKKLVYLILILPVIICLGCATAKPGANVAPKSTTVETGSATIPNSETVTKLPKSFVPTEQSINKVRQVSTVYLEVKALKVVQSFTPIMLKDINANSSFAGAVLTRCDFDVIKACASAGWNPSVILRAPTGQNHMRVVIGYNDPSEELTLTDPAEMSNVRQIKLSYADFERMWDDPQKTCLLVFPQYVAEQLIKSTLLKYLPKEKVDSVVIKSKAT